MRALLLRSGVVILVLGLAWIAVCVRFVVHPDIDEPEPVDVVYVLGGDDHHGWEAGLELIDQGYADELLISLPFGRPPECDTPPEGVQVTCFDPDPSTTRGEAQNFLDFAEENDWDSVIVVTWRSHLARSRMLMERCFDGEILMVEDHLPMTRWKWVEEFFYQSGAWVKTQILRGC